MVKQLKALREQTGPGGCGISDDAPDSQLLDGLRVMRSLGRMRALRDQLKSNPKRISVEYRKKWIELLGSEGRSFRHIDVNAKIHWKKYTSIRRVHYMFCMVLELMEQGKHDQAEGQVVQCLKALQEFAKHGSWRAAWELTYLNDPLKPDLHGGTEVEMETILGYLRTQDDLAKKAGAKDLRGLVSGAEDGEDGEPSEETPGGVPKKGKKKHA